MLGMGPFEMLIVGGLLCVMIMVPLGIVAVVLMSSKRGPHER